MTFVGLYQSQLSNSATLAQGTTVPQALNSLTDFDRFEAYNSLYLLVLFWLCGCTILCIKLMYEVFAARRLKQRGTSSLNPEWLLRFEQLKQQIGTKKDIAIRLSQRVTVPCVIGYFKPVVLIPTSLFLGMSSQQIEMIILHELAHIRRHDVLVSFVQATIKIIFFFSPAVHHLSNRIDQEREHACDDLAIDACGDAFSYAKTLQACAELHLSLNPRIALINHFFERNSMLKQRILRLFANPNDPQVKTRNTASIFLLLIVTLSIAGCSYMLINEPDLDVTGKAVRFEVSIKKNGELIAHPAVVSEFGKAITVEVDEQIKVTSVAQKPKGQKSYVEASIYEFDGKNWVLTWNPNMQAWIMQTPSFEFTSQDQQYRIVIKPRLTTLPTAVTQSGSENVKAVAATTASR